MLTFSELGQKGNLGNQLFQIASTMGLANKHNQSFAFPQWKYSNYFKYSFREPPLDKKFKHLKEQNFYHHSWNIEEENYDLKGWLQSEKYFQREQVKKAFTFKEEFLTTLKIKHNTFFDKKTILVTVRRGDFVNNPLFYQLSYKYYLLAIINNFSDWKERNIIFTSDDMNYCKYHFNFLSNAFFIENLSPIEQLALGTLFDDYIISNSTFSWWIAWLGEKPNSKIIRPKHNFGTQIKNVKIEKDYFPERWTIFDHHRFEIPLHFIKIILAGELYAGKLNFLFFLRQMKKKIKEKFKKLFWKNDSAAF